MHRHFYRIAAIDADFDCFFVKPVDIKNLYVPIIARKNRYISNVTVDVCPDV